MRHALIMAGGAGTRLWPLSRADRPKQLIRFLPRSVESGAADDGRGPASLLELAAERLKGLVEPERRYICTAEKYRDEIKRTVPGFTDGRILGEPAARDTVNAVGFGAAVFERADKDAVFCVLTSDQVIGPVDVFRERMELGFELVEADPNRLVTFSIRPTYPATGFGYVQRGARISDGKRSYGGHAFRVAKFVEKPDLPRAQAYFESGDFGWNSGMFVFSARTFMRCLERFKPESHEGLRRIQGAWDTVDQQRVLDEVYPTLPKISVDYAVMEPASEAKDLAICGVAMDVSWVDVGSWPSFAEVLAGDGDGNKASGPVDLAQLGSNGNVVVADERCTHETVALLGCEGLVVVRTPGATLVMPKERAQQLKDLHAALDERLK